MIPKAIRNDSRAPWNDDDNRPSDDEAARGAWAETLVEKYEKEQTEEDTEADD